MKILVLSESGYGAWFASLFFKEGHDVDYVVKPKFKNILGGIAPFFKDSIKGLNFAAYDLVTFDMTGNGQLADRISKVTNVIGDSSIADMLEDDRTFGIKVMEQAGIAVPPWHSFAGSDVQAAIKFINKTNKRYVFKPSGDSQDCAATYVSSSADDLVSYLKNLTSQTKSDFILQEFVSGIEVSTEAFFNGSDWYFVNNTFEEKKFMNDNVGPNTGCSGNLILSHGSSEPKIFTQGLKKLESFLKAANYRGMIDLNCIVTDNECYGLEWTPRFGYDASPTQALLIKDGYANFLHSIASGKKVNLASVSKGYAASVRISVPPYPLDSKLDVYRKDIPIKGIEPEDLEHCYLYDVYLNKDTLMTAGHEGFICCPMAKSDLAASDAFDVVKDKIKNIKIPNMQYRTDICKMTIDRMTKLSTQGWFSHKF